MQAEYYSAGLEECFLFDAVEDSYPITAVSGHIPETLRGTHYVNGPARFQRGDFKYKHWLDGDGMICALRFGPEGAHFTNRFIQTKKLQDEDAAGQVLYRGFGTAFRGDRLRGKVMLEPPVNVSVYPFAGSLLAFGEQTLPYELDPVTLETRGEYDFHGKLNHLSPFAAHAKLDPTSGHMLNFGISYAADHPVVNVYEFDAQGHQIRRRRHPLRYPHSNHDFGVTPNHVVFFLSPLLMDFGKFWGGVSVMESLCWQPELGSRILVSDRESKEPAFEVTAGQGYCLHLINCFEGGRRLIVDILEFESPVYPEYQPIPDLFATVTPCRPTRYVVDLNSKSVIERRVLDYDLSPDFPAIDMSLCGTAYDDFWMLGISAAGRPGRKFFDQLAHGSWSRGAVDDIYQAEPGCYLGGEPIYVEGSVIIQRLNTHEKKAEALIFDAAHVAKGPVAVLSLRHMIHPGFHASFASSA
jgi:carotenoid cleavage dioxygenase-like enzyme